MDARLMLLNDVQQAANAVLPWSPALSLVPNGRHMGVDGWRAVTEYFEGRLLLSCDRKGRTGSSEKLQELQGAFAGEEALRSQVILRTTTRGDGASTPEYIEVALATRACSQEVAALAGASTAAATVAMAVVPHLNSSDTSSWAATRWILHTLGQDGWSRLKERGPQLKLDLLSAYVRLNTGLGRSVLMPFRLGMDHVRAWTLIGPDVPSAASHLSKVFAPVPAAEVTRLLDTDCSPEILG